MQVSIQIATNLLYLILRHAKLYFFSFLGKIAKLTPGVLLD